MNKGLKTRLDNLPASWNQLKLKDYIKLINALPEDEEQSDTNDIDTPLTIISILSDTDIDLLEDLLIDEITPYISRVSFIYTLPDSNITSCKYKCRPIKDLKYSEFVMFQQSYGDNPYKAMDILLPLFFPELKEVDINELSIIEINECFFLLKKKWLKYLSYSQISLSLRLIKMKVKKVLGRT